MVRIVTVDGKPTYISVVENYEPQKLMDSLCANCFKIRPQYIGSISKREPFDKERAEIIKDVMMTKGLCDPRAFALGQALSLNWSKFKDLA